MVFLTGSKNLYEIIEIIADALIAGYASWSDGDVTWTTTDTSDNNARRCLKYDGDSVDIYIALECINTSTYYATGKYGKGLRVTFSSSWDDINHTYPVSNMQTNLYSVGDNTAVVTDLEFHRFDYYIWYEENGFILFSKPRFINTNQYTFPFLLCIERTDNKEYQDSQSNFCCYNEIYHTEERKNIIRPFILEADPNNGFQEILSPRFNSDNDKVYCAFPLYHNNETNTAPIFQSNFIIPWSDGKGLVSGDVISINGETTEYLLQELKIELTPSYILRFGIKMTA